MDPNCRAGFEGEVCWKCVGLIFHVHERPAGEIYQTSSLVGYLNPLVGALVVYAYDLGDIRPNARLINCS